MKVCKFGGTPLANSRQVKKVLDIIRGDSERKCIVVSAPGRNDSASQEKKVTDLFYLWHTMVASGVSIAEVRDAIRARYTEIISGLGVRFNISTELSRITEEINRGASEDYAASRGEYVMAKIVALALGYDFVDAEDLIFFDEKREIDFKKNDSEIPGVIAKHRGVVVPGFYGCLPSGSLKTFPRNGSDITGSLLARALRVDVYENWKDVPGLLMANPRVVRNSVKLERMSYRELWEITSVGGAEIFQEDAVFPVQEVGIPINIRNINDPEDTGTLITADYYPGDYKYPITAIAGRRDFTVITIEKTGMNKEVGYVRKILSILEDQNVSFDHLATGGDTISIAIETEQIRHKLTSILTEIRTNYSPNGIDCQNSISLIAVVGQHAPGVSAKVLQALAAKNIPDKIIDKGSSETSMVVGVHNGHHENAIRAIYEIFVS